MILGSVKRDHKAAVAEARVAQELDPLSLPVKSNAGWVYYWARQFDTAIAESRKELEMDENCLQAHYILGLASLAKLSGDKRKQHDSHLLFPGVSPIYDPLRSHPGFSALLREMNLEP